SRSVYGGFAVWQKGESDASSFAYPLDEEPQMDLRLLAVELDDKPKDLPSTSGMEQAQTSPFFKPWLARNDQELAAMIAAVRASDFTALGQLAELNANEMHAVNLTAWPDFTYFAPATLKAIALVQKLRRTGIECYYTIDAGPNVKILCQLKNVKEITKQFVSEFENVKIVMQTFGPGLLYLD
ncbi:diphosphomevalonate decarboxylase, partial [Lactobacillus sp. XV13L]|nr:diphosphomevalonate decarboxylase [Lactobacillus sp. XV13L]